MSRLVVTQNMTLDGVISPMQEWFAIPDDETDRSDELDALQEQMHAETATLFGRVTFEEFRGYWPEQTDDPTGITAHLNAVPKYVLSTTLEEPRWENTTVLQGPLLDQVRRLKGDIEGEIGVGGSVSLMPELVASDLVDEYRLNVHPFVLGHGRRLFADAAGVGRLRLVDARPFRSGIVSMTYRPA